LKPNITGKISIIISGPAAVGKTTLAASLASEFDLKLCNGGDILKSIAEKEGYDVEGSDWWDTSKATKFMRERKRNSIFDRKVDQKFIDISNKGNVVITSHTLPWLTSYPIKFWLSASQENRSKRMAKRDGISLKEALMIVKLRDEENKKIYGKIYGAEIGKDLSVFDFVLNTEILTLNSLTNLCKDITNNIIWKYK
jgi:cytidylate kinase